MCLSLVCMLSVHSLSVSNDHKDAVYPSQVMKSKTEWYQEPIIYQETLTDSHLWSEWNQTAIKLVKIFLQKNPNVSSEQTCVIVNGYQNRPVLLRMVPAGQGIIDVVPWGQ